MRNLDEVRSQLISAGLILDRDLVIDGRIQRWRVDGEDRERRGWTRLRDWVSKRGDRFVVGAFGIWHGTNDGYTKIELSNRGDEKNPLDEDDKRSLQAAQRASAQAVTEKRKREAKVTANWAATVWSHCSTAVEHDDYLTRKQIKGHGTRRLESLDAIQLGGMDETNKWRLQQAIGALVIPMHDRRGQVCGLQFIYGRAHPRKTKIDRDKEFWPTGMAMAGTFGVLGPVQRNGIILLSEGFATAASLREATGYTAVYAFSANNLGKAAKALRKQYPALRILICADDDYLTNGNPGVAAAASVTAQIELAAWIKPDFTSDLGVDLRDGRKLTDFNDLAVLTGIPLVVANQVHQALDDLGWRDGVGLPTVGPGDRDAEFMPSLLDTGSAARRFWGTYGLGGKVLFDEVDRRLVHRDDVINLLTERWDDLKSHPDWRVARDDEIGFDPTEADPKIKCNLFGGWPTEPKHGSCTELLGLLEYLCMNEPNADVVYWWILKWLAYPIQNPGAKMQSAIVVHGPQGTGKSRFFEAIVRIYGHYGRVLGQEALEDKFNADWAEKKLFILADEVLARSDMYHIKNRLKGFITGDTIRVNPKNIAAHNEKNHMNIVFLSNERMPLVLENDDRRHLVIWVPPKLGDDFFDRVNAEIDDGGVAALHDYLLNLDLTDFSPHTKPPMTLAKNDLVNMSQSSEERFIQAWKGLEIETPDGDVLPFCPCLGSSLYRAYVRWCDQNGERRRSDRDLVGMLKKIPGWTAGAAERCYRHLNTNDTKNRRMVVPSDADIQKAYQQETDKTWNQFRRRADENKSAWLTRCYFIFQSAMGLDE